MAEELRIRVDVGPVPDVGALLVRAREPIATLVFGHGAGADMRHATMEAIAQAFAAAGISTCLLYTSPSPRDGLLSRMPSSA